MDNVLIKKPGVRYRHVCDMDFLVDISMRKRHAVKTIHINEVTAFIWKAIGDDEEFNADTLTKLLITEYEVDEAIAHKDMLTLINGLLQAGVIIDPTKLKTKKDRNNEKETRI